MSDPTERMSLESYRRLRAGAKLIKETEWMRVYELGPKSFHYESKFLTDGLQISAKSFESRWPMMTPEERNSFASAYGAKADFTSDDEQIVNIIIKDGDERIWNRLASFMVTRHPEKDRVKRFIRERLEKHPDNPGNYIQALGIAKDQSAVPVLLAYYEEYRKAAQAVPEREDATFDAVVPIAEFLWCSEALWKITKSAKFAESIRAYLKHAHPQVRWWAGHSL